MGCLTYAFLFGCVSTQPQSPDVINQMIALKLGMPENYSLRFRLEARWPKAAKDAPRKVSYTAAIWKAGDRLRVDVWDREFEPDADKQNANERHIACRNCERPGYTLVTRVRPNSPKVTTAVEFRDKRHQPTDYFVADLDWRFLGVCNSPLSAYGKMPIVQSYRELAADPDLQLSERNRDTVPCIVSQIKKEKTQSNIWFSKREQLNPILMTFAGPGPDDLALTTEVRWRETAGKKLYPERIAHTKRQGGAVTYEEIITVLHADFNTQVDPVVFTLAGMGLNENQPVAYPGVPPEDWPVWHNGHADPALSSRAKSLAALAEQGDPIQPLPVPAAPYPVSNNTSLIFAVVSGVVALVALALVVVLRRRRK